MRLLQLAVVAVAFAPGASSAQEAPQRITLARAVEAVVSRNPGLEARRAQVEASRAARQETDLLSLPRLEAASAFTRGDDPVYVFGSLLRQGAFGPQNFSISSLNEPATLSNFSNSLEIGIPLFTAFDLSSRRKAAAMALGRSESRLEVSAQQTRRQAIRFILTILWENALTHELQERIDSSKNELADAEKLSKKGLVLGSDYAAARAILGVLLMRRLQAEKTLAAARSSLAVMMGLSGAVPDADGALAEPTYFSKPENAWLSDALAHRQELRDADLGASAAEAMEVRTRYSLLPRVDAFASLETNSHDLTGGPSDRMFGVRARLPLGDPTYFSRKAEARFLRDADERYSRQLRESIGIEVLEAYQRFAGAEESLPIARETVDRAEESLRKFRPLYHEGRQSILEVLRAEDGLAQARAAYLETLFDAHDGYAGLLLAVGELGSDAVALIDSQLRGAAR